MGQEKTKTEEYLQLGGINSKASQYATGAHEFLDLTNVNFKNPGALTKREGTTFYLGATVTGQVTGLYEFERLNGSSYVIATANTNAYSVTSTWSSFKSGLSNSALFDFSTFVDHLFAANGTDFFKTQNVVDTPFVSLPDGQGTWGVTQVVGGGLSGVMIASYGYYNTRGFFGPCATGITISLNGITFGSVQYYGLTTLAGYGISGLAFYRTQAAGLDLFRTYTTGSTTFTLDTGASALTNEPCPPYIWFTLAPKYLSIYSNRLFTAGFSSLLSTVMFSDVGEPEGVRPESNFEVRTNDGDRVTAMVPYSGTHLVFKERSFHRLSGDSANNFVLSEVSDQYGCLSNRAVVVFGDVCLFLDRKGVAEFNGANIRILSDKIEAIFLRMNVDSAKDKATAVHDRLKNQVKFSFPVDGSTENNMTVVYDYLAQAWTTEVGYKPAINSIIRGSLSAPTVFFGGYTGTISNFGASYLGDAGSGITCLIKTRFLADFGNSIEKVFRRLYLDVVPQSSTGTINVNFMQNYGASFVLNRTMYQNPFQSRIDFGISSKSLAFEATHFSATMPFQLNGYTIEYRMQRRV